MIIIIIIIIIIISVIIIIYFVIDKARKNILVVHYQSKSASEYIVWKKTTPHRTGVTIFYIKAHRAVWKP